MHASEFLAGTEFAIAQLRAVDDRDWSVRAGSLEWDIAFTVTHIAGAVMKYGAYLAAAATKWSPTVVSRNQRASNEQLVDGVEIAARSLAFIADHVGASTRGYHAYGMSDAASFLARAANEVLVHTWDVAAGLEIDFTPPPEMCVPVIRQRHPWVDASADPWPTLLSVNGRTGEDGWEVPLECPLAEWNGVAPLPSAPGPAIAWEWDASTERWDPVYP